MGASLRDASASDLVEEEVKLAKDWDPFFQRPILDLFMFVNYVVRSW
jgi:hypothetical protein